MILGTDLKPSKNNADDFFKGSETGKNTVLKPAFFL
ncbi:hypothetical protein M2135_001029 [Parabacteroides sp. PF5-9]|nr:hypothetical protein [Parabacteroides sp. PF5-9]